MKVGVRSRRRGAAIGDVLIGMAGLCVVAALLYPTWSTRGFRALVERAIADVDMVGAAVRSARDDTDRWPTVAPPGEAPAELARLGGDAGPFNRLEYTLGWTSWEVVDSVEAPPDPDVPLADDAPSESLVRMEPVVRRIGAVTVHSGDESLLAELGQHYADETTFVLDTVWHLVLPERARAPVTLR